MKKERIQKENDYIQLQIQLKQLKEKELIEKKIDEKKKEIAL